MRLRLLMFIFLMSAHAQAELFFYEDTQSFLDVCESNEMFCAGYLVGVSDAWENWRAYEALEEGQEQPPACVPAGVTAEQLVKVFRKFMEDHPENLHSPALGNAIQAAIDAFDCATE